MSQCANFLCALHKFFLTLTQISPENGRSGGGASGVLLLWLSRALFDRICRAFSFPAHSADIEWRLRRSRPRGPVAAPNPAI